MCHGPLTPNPYMAKKANGVDHFNISHLIEKLDLKNRDAKNSKPNNTVQGWINIPLKKSKGLFSVDKNIHFGRKNKLTQIIFFGDIRLIKSCNENEHLFFKYLYFINQQQR